jgi:hypothetical protein
MQICSTRVIASFYISAQSTSWSTIHKKDFPNYYILYKIYAGDQDILFRNLICVLNAFYTNEYFGCFLKTGSFFKKSVEERGSSNVIDSERGWPVPT